MSSERKRPFKPRKGPDAPRSQIAQIVRDMILSGEVAAGESPPSERLLSQRYAIHRDTVHRAFLQLEREGMLEKVPRGWRVTPLQNAPAPGTILRDTVMIVTPGELVYDPRRNQGGWSDVIAFGAIEEMRQHNLDTLLVSYEKFLNIHPLQLSASGICGLLITDTDNKAERMHPALRNCQQAGIPVVGYGNNPLLPEISRVYSDHAAGVEQTLDWLAAQGCKRVLSILPDNDYYWTQARAAGYLSGVQRHGLRPLDIVRVPTTPAASTGEDMARHLEADARHFLGYLADRLITGDGADAILASSDGQIFPIAQACLLLGLNPKKDIIICGYDNYWQDCPEQTILPFVPATTVDKLNNEMGRALGRLLQRHVTDKKLPYPQIEVIEPRLLVPEAVDAGA